MPVIERPSGLRVDLPDTFRIAPMPTPRRVRRTRAPLDEPVVPTDAASASAETNVLIAALENQRIELVDAVPLQPAPGAPAAPAGRRRRGPTAAVPPRQAVELSLPIQADEHAVVLLEQDGVYRWKLPDDVVRPRQPRARRGAIAEPAAGQATFRIELFATPEDARGVRRQTRGVVSHFVFGEIRAFVLKFAAHAAVGKIMAHLERDIHSGLVAISSPDPTTWTPVEPPDVKLPRGRPARVLLLVHGTFSSTVGCFGGLGAHPWGKQFLQSALDTYDAVLGYDHHTLSVDPLENASDLMEQLRSLGGPPPTFDVVTHSRGGLVTRSLIELLLPFERDWKPRIDRVVFVASTNHGTRLAEPDNWNAFIDLYTNLVMAATRALGLIPQARLFALIVGGVVQGVGALVKYMVGALITDKDVPGLAAMEPDGEFVTKINETHAGQPDPQHSSYFAVTSDFEVNAPGDGSKELPPKFLLMLADGFIDRLFKAASDLVVDVASMTAIDPKVEGFVDDTYEFGTNPFVYHCNYFLRPELTTALAHWLALPQAADGNGGGAPPAPPGAPGSVVHPRLSVRANTNFVEAAADTVGSVVRKVLRTRWPDYVVVRRSPAEGGYLYAFHRDEVLAMTGGARRHAPLRDSLELHESDESPRVGISQTPRIGVAAAGAPPTTRRHVIVAGERPVGVLPEPQAAPPIEEAAREARRARPPGPSAPSPSRPSRGGGRGAGRRGAGGVARAVTRRTQRPASRTAGRRAAPPATPHVHAEMPPEVRVGQTASVRVEISAHALAPARGRASKEGKLGDAFDPSKPLTVQVMARANLEVSGADRVEDVKAPGPKDLPVELFFDVKGVSAGDGELWVMVRQGPPPLLTLTLAPEVVGAGAPEAETEAPARPRVRAESDVPATVPAPWLLPTLAVNERRTQDGVVYEYDLDLLEDGRYRSSSPPIQGDRDAYVNSIYSYLEDTWLETKDDLEKFRSEVRAYGGELFDQLFPKELQQRLWQHRARLKNIRILSTEPFIPWELVHLKSPGGRLPRETIYLAQMGLVRWLFDKPGPPTQLRVRDGRAWYVTPNYPDPDYVLEEPAKEAAFLEKMFAAKPVPASTAPVMALLTKRGKVDLFHFAGHGTATGGSVEDAAILLEGRYDPNAAAQQAYVRDDLTARRIEQEAELARPGDPIRPLVVLNACQVGRPGLQLSSIGGFAEAFIHAGAGAFVSSLWSVGDEPAASFTTELYRRLRAGDAIAKASVAAREKARAAGDATWLAYVVYAHPDAKLVRRP